MRAYQSRQVISETHILTVQLPADVPAGPAEVIVLYDDQADGAGDNTNTAQDLAAFFDLVKALPPSGRSREDIDRQIQAERDAWE
jgi:hypothetical protein